MVFSVLKTLCMGGCFGQQISKFVSNHSLRVITANALHLGDDGDQEHWGFPRPLEIKRAGETMKPRGSCTGWGAAKAGAVARVAAVSTARATVQVVVRRRVVEA